MFVCLFVCLIVCFAWILRLFALLALVAFLPAGPLVIIIITFQYCFGLVCPHMASTSWKRIQSLKFKACFSMPVPRETAGLAISLGSKVKTLQASPLRGS